ncbi:MAG: aminopeptidase P family protein [Alphaproteobacteria bacterium]|nr:aminopeptidase P family protein [Alphaproteobacteria bacterium]
MQTSAEKLKALRNQIKAAGLNGFIVPRADEYQGEFVAPYAERLKWLTGFTGSAGTAVVLEDKACILTDGRYLLQIAQEIDAGLFEIVDITKTPLEKWLAENVGEQDVIGYDPWLHTPDQLEKLRTAGASLRSVEGNLLDQIWADQPARPQEPAYLFPQHFAGRSTTDKIGEVRAVLRESKASACIIGLPDSVNWLLNVRGGDVKCTPLVLSYAIVQADEDKPVQWIVESEKIPSEVNAVLKGIVEILPPSSMSQTLKTLAGQGAVALDFKRCPAAFKEMLEAGGAEIKDITDPCIRPKALKTPQEQEAICAAHIADGVALVKFLHWLDTSDEPLDEVKIDEVLTAFRARHPDFKGASFPTIAGFAANGAVIHYRARPETARRIEGDSLLLIDSGAQYLGENLAGTTDITRTIAIGTPSQEMKERFTDVLKGHIALAMAHFPEGTTGAQLDTLARAPLWNMGLDYAHGTGHGVGCYLAVHEDAASLSPRGTMALEEGMLLSNEPGYYKAEGYGIRIENLVLVKKTEVCADTGKQMLCFETVSLAPIDHRLIISEALDAQEAAWLGEYHKRVYKTLMPYLDEKESVWLKSVTKSA